MIKYCKRPFTALRTHPYTTNQEEYRPCCHYKESVPANNVIEYLNSTELAKLQQQLLNDTELPAGCSKCSIQEQRGLTSWRERYNQNFTPITNTKITEFEIFISNTCNLKCFMCNPTSSTALGEERQRLGWIADYRKLDFVDQTIHSLKNLPDLTEVSFIGGEFFLAKECLEILDIVIEKQLFLKIITNGTIITPHILNKLSQVRKLDIQVSLDGTEKSYEFMRYPAVWSEVDANIKKLKSIFRNTNTKLHVSTIVQPLNFLYIIDILEYCNKNILMVTDALTSIESPSWLEWAILTDVERSVLVDKVKEQELTQRLVSNQMVLLNQFYNNLAKTKFNAAARRDFISRMNQILKLRNIPNDRIYEHFGCLTKLADEVIAGSV